jgi:hypothetical protein
LQHWQAALFPKQRISAQAHSGKLDDLAASFAAIEFAPLMVAVSRPGLSFEDRPHPVATRRIM